MVPVQVLHLDLVLDLDLDLDLVLGPVLGLDYASVSDCLVCQLVEMGPLMESCTREKAQALYRGIIHMDVSKQ